MAKRFYIDFSTIQGEDWTVEVHDTNFVGTAIEVDGDFEGLRIEYAGEQDVFSPIVPSTATFRMIVPSAGHDTETFLTDLAGAKEGRFHLVIKRDAAVYWLGYIVNDQVSIPDKFYPFHASLTAIDGIARMKHREYKEIFGAPYTGRETILEHFYNVITHIGLMGLSGVTMPTIRFRSNVNWFDAAMVTTTDPLAQADIDHVRFQSKDKQGFAVYWTVYEVLEAICRQFGGRFFFAEGSYWFFQTLEYENSTQTVHTYNSSGALIAKTTGVSFDKTIDFVSAWKRSGGNWTFLPPLLRVINNYYHLTNVNRAKGLFFNAANPGPETLIGTLAVDAVDTTRIRAQFNIRTRTTDIGAPPTLAFPYHRYYFDITIKIGSGVGTTHYLFRELGGNIYAPTYDEDATWEATVEAYEAYSGLVSKYDNGADRIHPVEFTTPYLGIWANQKEIELTIILNRIEDEQGTTWTNTGSNFFFEWDLDDPFVEVLGEGSQSVYATDVLKFKVNDTSGANTQEEEFDTYFGDGPLILSLSSLQVGGVNTSLWKVSGTGTGYDINKLIAKEILELRNKPLEIYQGTFIKDDIHLFSRIVSDGKSWIPLRLSYSAFYDLWEGDFAKIAKAPTTINVDDPEPFDPNNDPFVPHDGGVKFPSAPVSTDPFTPLGAVNSIFNSIAPATLDGTQLKADINTPTPNEVTINPVSYVFAKAGDTFKIINPATFQSEIITIAANYVPGATTLQFTEDVIFDYPSGSFLVPQASVVMTNSGGVVVQKQGNYTGDTWTITAGTLPNPASVSESEIDRRVKVWRSGLRVPYNTADGFVIDYAANRIDFQLKVRGETLFLELSN